MARGGPWASMAAAWTLAAAAACLPLGCGAPQPSPPEYVPRTAAVERSNAAMESLRAGDLEEALALLDAAVEEDPRYAPAHINRATVLARLGRLEEAAEAAGDARAADPDQPEGTLMLGMLRERLEDPTAARELYAEAVAGFERMAEAGMLTPEQELKRAMALYMAQGIGPAVRVLNDLSARDPRFLPARRLRQQMLQEDRAYFLARIEGPAGSR